MLKKERKKKNKSYLTYRRRKWQSAPVFLSGEFHEPRSPAGTVHFSSVTQSCLTYCNPMDCSTPGFPVHHQLQELTQTHVHGIGDTIQLFHPLSSPSPPAFNLSQHQGFSNESVLIRWPKYWNFSFNICPSNEHSGLISFRMNWLYPLAVQGNLKSLFQYHSSKALIVQCSAFFKSNSHIHTWLPTC